MRTAFFLGFTQRVMSTPHRRFGTTFLSHCQGLRIQKLRWGITTSRCVMTLKNAVPIYFVAEAWRFRIVNFTCLPFPLCLNTGRLWLYLTLQSITISSCSVEWLTSLARISAGSYKNLQNPNSLYERILIVFLSTCNFLILFPLTRMNLMEVMEGNRINVSYFN